MTEHEAITAIINRGGVMSKNNAGDDIAMGFIQAAITLMQSCVKYRWHDLRKNPEDLPEVGEVVLTLMHYDDELEYEVALYAGDVWQSNCLIVNQYLGTGKPAVLVWKRIEPFEEERNER